MSLKREQQLLGIAIALAASMHQEQFDRGGLPYILHCLTVMHKVKSDDHWVKQVAVMHDIVEDTSVTLEQLTEMGFHKDVVEAIGLLTHKEGESYEDYIEGISKNKIARVVKMADLRHNSDITRLKGVSMKDIVRMEKYHRAYLLLKAAF